MIKFLVIRFSSIGDIVLASPVVRCLKMQSENAEIHFLVKPAFESLASSNPYISKVHVLKKNLKETIDELKLEFFDYVIDLHNNIRSYRVKQKLGLPSFSFHKLNYEKWLMVNFRINKLPDKHIVDRYLDTLDIFDIKNDEKGLDFFIQTGDEFPVNDKPAGFIAFIIGAKHFTKQLPATKIASICRKLDLPVILLGGKEDIEKANAIMESAGNNVINMCGKLSLGQSADVVRQSCLVITHDTGLMHIAASFRKNIISIWGNTIPEFGMYPYHPGEKSKIFEVMELKCRPCTKIGFKSCPKKHFRCMNNIDEDCLVSYAKEIYNK